MKLLKKLTIKSLKLNKKRTIVTVIGIMLATALITAIASLLVSFRQSLIDYEIQERGRFHYAFFDVPQDELKYIENNRNVENYYTIENLGYGKLENSRTYDYVYLKAFDDKALQDSYLKLKEGRLPETDTEIVISKNIITEAGVKYKVGDEITLNVGKRIREGEEINQSTVYYEEEITDSTEELPTVQEPQEEFVPEFTKTYKVVGIIERPSIVIEPYTSSGYTVITYLADSKKAEDVDIFTWYKDLDDRFKTTADILGITEDELTNGNGNPKYDYFANRYVIRYQTLSFNDGAMNMLYSISAIGLVIIILTSIFCIRNSFAISLTEKVKQYGMLKSVGATGRQIKKNVYYEALILALIGIPLGIIAGIFATFILLKIIVILIGELLNLELNLKISWVAALAATILALITIFLSARKSAKKASKLSPIDAIRESEEIKIKPKKLKTPKIIKKLFGIGGVIAYKNLKRNKRKYRVTVISIVVSVSVFVAMSSFVDYAFKATNILFKQVGYDMYVSGTRSEGYEKLKEISKLDGIKDYTIQRDIAIFVDNNSLKYTDKYEEIYLLDEERESHISIYSIGDSEYNKYLKELGLNYNDAKDKAIVINSFEASYNEKYVSNDILEIKTGDSISGRLSMTENNFSIEVTKVTDKMPMGFESTEQNSGVELIVSDELMDKYKDDIQPYSYLYLHADDADKLEETIKAKYENMSDDGNINVYNIAQEARALNSMFMVIAIFLYGFIAVISLIGITNIFNTITTNMSLRSKEFAMLKSIGMTKQKFTKMIRLESIFYGVKSLLIGLPIGVIASILIHNAFLSEMEFEYMFPLKGIVISIVLVFILIASIMKYSLNKINKQNIIETIRKDNI